MACAKCLFYLYKSSLAAQYSESRQNLLKLMQEISLIDDGRAVGENDIGTVENLLDTLINIEMSDKKEKANKLISGLCVR